MSSSGRETLTLIPASHQWEHLEVVAAHINVCAGTLNPSRSAHRRAIRRSRTRVSGQLGNDNRRTRTVGRSDLDEDPLCERRTRCAAGCTRSAHRCWNVPVAGRRAHVSLLAPSSDCHCSLSRCHPRHLPGGYELPRQAACGSEGSPSPSPASQAPSHSRPSRQLQLGSTISIHHCSGDCSLWRSHDLSQLGRSRSRLEYSMPPGRRATHINEPIQQSNPLANGTSALGHLLEIVRVEDDGVAGRDSRLAGGVTDGSVARRVRRVRTNGPSCALRPGRDCGHGYCQTGEGGQH